MRGALAVSLFGLLACSERPALPTLEPPPDPVLLVSQKGARSVAWYSLKGDLLEEVPVSDHPHEIVLSPDGRRLYVTDNGVMQIENAGEGGNKVTVIDVPNRAKGGQIDLGKWHRPHGVDLCADGSLLVTTENPDQLLVIDLDKLHIRYEYETGGETPHIVKCSRDSRFAFVSNARSGTVAKITLDSGERELLETGDRPEGSTLSKDGSKLYVAHRDADKVVIIDTIAWRIVGEIPTGKSPVRCGLASNEEVLVYALFGDSAVGFADIASRTETGRIPVAGPAVSLEMHDDETALTCAQEQDVCYVVSAAERRILHEVKVRRGANPDPALLLEP
ncbi:MAG: YncE family protein [Acidobacteria bacterium]|nr:YncE family protein [Acidobacteriota bacterium]